MARTIVLILVLLMLVFFSIVFPSFYYFKWRRPFSLKIYALFSQLIDQTSWKNAWPFSDRFALKGFYQGYPVKIEKKFFSNRQYRNTNLYFLRIIMQPGTTPELLSSLAIYPEGPVATDIIFEDGYVTYTVPWTPETKSAFFNPASEIMTLNQARNLLDQTVTACRKVEQRNYGPYEDRE